MSGHSKWANIKHKKAKTDAAKGKIFTKLAREIIVATRAGGSDPNGNFRLKIAIENAKAENMPNDNINRAIQKGAGEGEGSVYEELRYEGYGPGGVAVMVDIMTDNRNRTASEIRHFFSKNGGNMGDTGSVSWMFVEKGQLNVPKEDMIINEDDLFLLALETGAEDVLNEEERYVIYTDPVRMETIRQRLLDQRIPIATAAVNLIPLNKMEISELDQAKKVIKLMDSLESHDDVQNVYTNLELADTLSEEEF